MVLHSDMPVAGEKERTLGSVTSEHLLFSFIIPTFNRVALVQESIRSALDWLSGKLDGEIIVVDDCSTDGTSEMLAQVFAAEIKGGLVRPISLSANVGVIKAKNTGARVAAGRWLIFLDSDDLMIPTAAAEMRAEITKFPDAPIIFFGCEDLSTREKIGIPVCTAIMMHFHDYLNDSDFGERLPIVRKEIATQFPYEETLNGWEGLTTARILRHFEPLVLSPVVGRRYRREGKDRLSSAAGRRIRARSIARGYFLWVWEFAPYMKVTKAVYYLTKAAAYYVMAALVA
jgi:glycosyltransferase involved in cell wall biosynthesis